MEELEGLAGRFQAAMARLRAHAEATEDAAQMRAELEGLRAERARDVAELNALLEELKPLVGARD